MTRIQRGWAVAAALAGALLACTIALIAAAAMPPAPSIALALLSCILFIIAARQARRP